MVNSVKEINWVGLKYLCGKYSSRNTVPSLFMLKIGDLIERQMGIYSVYHYNKEFYGTISTSSAFDLRRFSVC